MSFHPSLSLNHPNTQHGALYFPFLRLPTVQYGLFFSRLHILAALLCTDKPVCLLQFSHFFRLSDLFFLYFWFYFYFLEIGHMISNTVHSPSFCLQIKHFDIINKITAVLVLNGKKRDSPTFPALVSGWRMVISHFPLFLKYTFVYYLYTSAWYSVCFSTITRL